jgi:putative transposon-encoded protein
MKKIRVELTTRLEVEGILGFVERHVTPFGTGAKVDCPKEYLGKRVFLVILRD